MKKFLIGGGLILSALLVYSFVSPEAAEKNLEAGDGIEWQDWNSAIKMAEESPKKLFVDIYTDWCGWCKKMDKSTFQDPSVVKYINDNFIPVKFNAEQKEEIDYKGHTLKFRASGRRGVHELAYSLLDGRLGYPAYVYLDEQQNRITISPGYKDAKTMIKELEFIGGDHYKTTSYDQFVRAGARGSGK